VGINKTLQAWWHLLWESSSPGEEEDPKGGVSRQEVRVSAEPAVIL